MAGAPDGGRGPAGPRTGGTGPEAGAIVACDKPAVSTSELTAPPGEEQAQAATAAGLAPDARYVTT
ncbi:hypothetical protein GCM10020220_021430 [Nonomuraea rubra]